jgi:hypothetical protein
MTYKYIFFVVLELMSVSIHFCFTKPKPDVGVMRPAWPAGERHACPPPPNIYTLA